LVGAVGLGLGLLMLGVAGRGLRRGELTDRGDRITRSGNPVWFWSFIGWFGLCGTATVAWATAQVLP
jgi:hypothetical protein